jgi:hypothetical protein
LKVILRIDHIEHRSRYTQELKEDGETQDENTAPARSGDVSVQDPSHFGPHLIWMEDRVKGNFAFSLVIYLVVLL